MAFSIYEPYGGFHELKSLQVMGTASMIEPFSDEYIKIMEFKNIPLEAMKKLPQPMNLIKIVPGDLAVQVVEEIVRVDLLAFFRESLSGHADDRIEKHRMQAAGA